MVPASWASGATLYGPWPSPNPSAPMPATAFRRWAGFVRPCLVTSHQGKYKAMTQRAIFWPLLVIKLIEKGGYVWSLGMADKQRGDFLIGRGPCGRNKYLCVCVHVCLCVCVCACPCASGSVCGIILENLSLWRGTDVDLHMWRVPSLWWD